MSNGVLAGKVAVVTGAGRGTGRGIALALSKAGAAVVLASRSQAPIDEVASEIEALGGTALPVRCDVGRRDEVAKMVAEAVDRLGPVDVLVNCAQSWGPTGENMVSHPLYAPEELPEDAWDNTFLTGVKATFYCCQEVFPSMRDRGGKIINFGSGAGVYGHPDMADYAANKEAIRGLTRSLARAWGQYGISVNVICPTMETDALRGVQETDPELVEATLRNRAMKRFGDPERDAGALAVFLSGPGADYLTGGTFMLDGGSIMIA